ncbi:NB-ARC domain-containing protein [Kribbella sp. VKM Ac-2527]|uniref:NB-ARC domain-containing protein n=1 Tax=Kribbella caucasensis TaxID=2512215 RepID=A0A4R6KTX2_9ACTN|nr:XRE family transcriptional regulator [Kribbella sp. VKM Ac-2527]TDO54507.1 NB-ARC domain-containing protein [Kribbella sp. VKM Ac-2527]
MSSADETIAEAAGVAQLLRRFRKRSGLTQEALAERSGLSVEGIRALEGGRRRHPRVQTVEALIDGLRLPENDAGLFRQTARRVDGEPGIPRQLPPPIADFTGRADRLDELLRILREPQAVSPAVVVSAIGGMGGVGKTTLAVHAAQLVADDFPDGQLYLNLRGGTAEPLSAAEALQALLQTLGVPPAGPSIDQQVLAARYRTALAGRRMVLLLDDAANADQVLPLMPGTAGPVVVITSRQELSALPGVHHLHLDVMTEAEALKLFGEVVGHDLVAEQPEASVQVVHRCGLLPLAIRIAGGQLSRLQHEYGAGGLEELAARLADDADRLDMLTTPDVGVRRSIMLSVAALASGDPARDVPVTTYAGARRTAAEAFGCLALFDGDRFPLRAAAKVLELPMEAAENLLEHLVDVHLLENPALHQYRMHDLVRDVGRELATTELDESARADVRRREFDCYLAMLWRYDDLTPPGDAWRPPDGRGWSADAEDVVERSQVIEWLEAELPNVVRLVRGLAAGSAEDQVAAVRMALGMWRVAITLVRFGEAREALTLVVGLPIDKDTKLEWTLVYRTGALCDGLGLYEEGLYWRRLALPVARELADPTSLAATLIDVGYGLGRVGRAAEGLAFAEEALAVIERFEVHIFEVGGLVAVGALAGWLGDLARQRSAFDRAISLMSARSKPVSAVVHRNLIGRSLQESGQYEAALSVLTEALTQARALQAEVIESDSLLELGCTWLALGEQAQAREVLTAGLEIAVRYPADHREGALRHQLGLALTALGLLDEARQEWEQANMLYQRMADPRAKEVRELLDETGDRE